MAAKKASSTKSSKKTTKKKTAARTKTTKKTTKKKAAGKSTKKTPAKKAGRKKAVAAVEPTYDEIAARAFTVWQRKGCPDGRDMDNWREAEAELRAERGLV